MARAGGDGECEQRTDEGGGLNTRVGRGGAPRDAARKQKSARQGPALKGSRKEENRGVEVTCVPQMGTSPLGDGGDVTVGEKKEVREGGRLCQWNQPTPKGGATAR